MEETQIIFNPNPTPGWEQQRLADPVFAREYAASCMREIDRRRAWARVEKFFRALAAYLFSFAFIITIAVLGLMFVGMGSVGTIQAPNGAALTIDPMTAFGIGGGLLAAAGTLASWKIWRRMKKRWAR